MQKEDVLAYIRPMPLLHSLDVPYARLFVFLFASGQNKRSCYCKSAWLQRVMSFVLVLP